MSSIFPGGRRLAAASLLVAIVALACAAPASAQYFGQNKVKYKDLDFEILRTDHFDIYFYPQEREAVQIAARMAERWRARLGEVLDHELSGRQPLVLYASHPDFEQTNTIQGVINEGTGGVTEPLRRRIILPFAGPLAETDHVLGHELVHAYQFDMTTRPDSAPGMTGAHTLPLWFIEGMAEYLSIGPVDPLTAMWLRDAARPGQDEKSRLPSVDDLSRPEYFPYRWGHAFWAYVAGRWGDAVVGEMLRTGAAAGNYAAAIQDVLGMTTKELTVAWHAAIRAAYDPILREASPPQEVGRLTIAGDNPGDMNVSPAVSPDGRWIAFLSERGLFSIDLFLADTATGKVRRRLTSTATDPHTTSLQFIHSAGGWDAGSRRLAIATVVSGRAALAIIAADTGDRERDIRIDAVDEIFNPTWAPDGSAIAFTGMAGGLTDLYVVDLTTSAVRRLTNDPFADLQPAWSPDGRSLAFATDRFSSRLDALEFGPYRLALIDPAGGPVQQVAAFTGGKNINPQWAPDGGAIYFLSDRDGIPNLYRVTLAGEITQLTSVMTGLSGITSTSPAISVASRTGTIAVTVYDRGAYRIYSVDPARGAPPRDVVANAAILPPVDRKASTVARLLADAASGLPPATQNPDTEDYTPKLALEAVAQPSLAIGADRYGAAIAGGIAFYFRDMLGDQSLIVATQLSQSFNRGFTYKDVMAQVAYLNERRRLNWGVIAGQVPYVSGGFRAGTGNIQNEPAYIEEEILLRQSETSAAGLVAYPFNRAQRIEFQGGVTHVSFDEIVTTRAVSLRTGDLIVDDTVTTAVQEPLSLVTSSAALVYDTSVFGATSPVQGQRYRLEATPTFGGITYTSLLADYRRYVMPVSFYTIAARVMHYGRYGTGGEDVRLFPLYIGNPGLIRGYNVGSFDTSDCVPGTVVCPVYDQLLGSRMLVGNLELRFPLLRPFGASRAMYGPLPVEVALFADAGVAWFQGQRPSLLGGERNGVSSAGVAFRVNFFGFAVGEFDVVRPLQRGNSGWAFQFNFLPGF